MKGWLISLPPDLQWCNKLDGTFFVQTTWLNNLYWKNPLVNLARSKWETPFFDSETNPRKYYQKGLCLESLCCTLLVYFFFHWVSTTFQFLLSERYVNYCFSLSFWKKWGSLLIYANVIQAGDQLNRHVTRACSYWVIHTCVLEQCPLPRL